jgi:hypothetical protein
MFLLFLSINANYAHSMIVTAVYALIIFHPGVGFQNKFNEIKYQAVQEVEGGKEDISLNGTEDAPCFRQ